MQVLPSKGSAVASSLGTPPCRPTEWPLGQHTWQELSNEELLLLLLSLKHWEHNCVQAPHWRGEQDTGLQKSWRAGSVSAETWLSLLPQICSHSAHQAQGLQGSFSLVLRPCSHSDSGFAMMINPLGFLLFPGTEAKSNERGAFYCISISVSFPFSPFLLCIIFPFDSASLLNGEMNFPGSILSEKD